MSRWVAGWLAGLNRCMHLQQGSCLAGGASCMPTCCSHTQNSTTPSILDRFSSQGYQKVLEFTGGLENAVRPAVRCTESTTPINPRSKEIYKLWFLLLLAFAWLQHPVLELSWPASASIIQSGGVQINP